MRTAFNALLLIALTILGACTSAPRMTTAERLEFYRSHAGEPIRSFASPARLWGWRSVGDSALTVWTRRDQGYLLELSSRCPDLAFASKIGLSTRTGRVSAGFDSIIVARRGASGPAVSCRIQTIRPLDTRSVREYRRDLNEVDVVERDAESADTPE